MIARSACVHFGVAGTPRFITHGANKTFRVDDVGRSYSLRIHNPSYHSVGAISSERAWLNALADESDILVPTPHKTKSGDWVATITSPSTGQVSNATLSDWIDGIQRRLNPEPAHFRAIGETMARLHEHASSWSPPPDFHRPVWDVGGIFWEHGQGGDILDRALKQLSNTQAETILRAREPAERVIRELRDIPDAWGLIHADLHLANNVFQSARACPIDFDDCGFGSYVYDAVVAVHFHSSSPHFRAFLGALREGYERVRRFPSEGLHLVPSLIAMRSASVAIWIASQVDENGRYQELFSTYVDGLMTDVLSLANGTVSEWHQ